MNKRNESKSLGRLIVNLESDPDIQAAIQIDTVAQDVATECEKLELLKEHVFQMVQDAMACCDVRSHAPAEWLQNALKEFGTRADRFCNGFGSRIVELVRIPDSGFVRTAPVLSHASGETLPTKAVRLDEFIPEMVLNEHLPWVGRCLRVTAAKIGPASANNAFRIAVELREGSQNGKGELAIGIKFESESEFVILSQKQASTVLRHHGPEQLNDLFIQVFALIAV